VIVLDASAAVDLLLQTSAGKNIERRIYARNESLHAPELLDLEVTQVLRRLAHQAIISSSRSAEALHDLLDLRLTRYSHCPFLPRIWELRHNFSSHDAAYLVLAESLKAPLVTRDRRLAAAPGHSTAIEVY
jgi:predicted nucleic acid-binding protein